MVTAAMIETAPYEVGSPTGSDWDVDDALAPVLRAWNMRPRLTAALVPRPRLVRALSAHDGPALAVLVAPAGYGKTTLLLEWSERDERPFAWITLDERDNDPGRLLASVRRAVAAALGATGARPFVLVIDDAQTLREPLAFAALAAIASDLPPQAKLVISSREQPRLAIARMRADRGVTEIGPRELAMTRAEVRALLKAERHDVGREGVDILLARTEGWPVALSLASLYLADRGASALTRFGGADRFVAQYVRDEVLSDLSPEQLDFMLRTSIVATMTAPLCDSLTGKGSSGPMLAALAHAGLVVALDRSGERYRHHRLLAQSLRAELHINSPARDRDLQRRASAWHREAGDVDHAIDHALSAGELGDAGSIVWSNLAGAVAEGRTSTVERWLGRFTQNEIAEHATLAVTAAGCALLRGQGHMAAHWTARAAAAVRAGKIHDLKLAAGIAVLQAALGSAGSASPFDAAPAAGRLDDGAGRAAGALIAGMTRRHQGDHDGAAAALDAGARLAAVSAPGIHALCLAELAVLALEESDWECAAAFVARGRAQVDRYGLADQAAMALVFAVSALVRSQRGRVDAAQSDLREAVRLHAAFVDFWPEAEAEVCLTVARAALRLCDVSLARAQLSAATRLLRRTPGAIALHRSATDAMARLDAFTASDSSVSESMTAAELRILRHLPTHLSFREIGELTYVSANTVKTQANAVYRKLGVSCRSDAVARARDYGLLDRA
jgi:LuxR family transcriptional regulator, maltose regulon positive regulatory protein